MSLKKHDINNNNIGNNNDNNNNDNNNNDNNDNNNNSKTVISNIENFQYLNLSYDWMLRLSLKHEKGSHCVVKEAIDLQSVS